MAVIDSSTLLYGTRSIYTNRHDDMKRRKFRDLVISYNKTVPGVAIVAKRSVNAMPFADDAPQKDASCESNI